VEAKIMKDSTKAQDTGTARSRESRRGILVALVIVAGAASLGLAKPAQADNLTLYATSFERPTFRAGEQLLGLDGWSTAIPPFLNPQAATITREAARHSRQSVEVRGGDLIGSEGITAPYDAVGSYRRPLNHAISADKPLARVDADLLLDTHQPETRGEFFSLTIAARSENDETLGEIGLSSDGTVEAFGFNVVSGGPPVFSKPIRLNKWYHITMLLDFANRTTSYFIDEHFLGAIQAPSASNVLTRGAMVVYARPDGDESGGAGSTRSSYTARFDNFRVSVHSAAPDIDD
jgi:hypothetical protein